MTTEKTEDIEMKDNEKQEEVSKEKSQEEKDAMAFDGERGVLRESFSLRMRQDLIVVMGF